MSAPNNDLSRTLIAALSEFTGTFFLALAALSVLPPLTVLAVALTLMVFVYTVGDISGCHLNPAVTAGLVATRQFPLGAGAAYIVAQVAGAMTARAVVVNDLVGTLGSYEAASAVQEFIGFGLLMLAVAAVTENKVTRSGSGIAVGGALGVGLLTSGGILNPAIAVAMGLPTSAAVWAPLLSGVVFASLFVLLKKGAPPKAP